jgi:hypothetical protein
MACGVFVCDGTGIVNCEALMRAGGQNLKRLLKKRGWGRRPYPTEALYAPLFGSFWVVSLSFFSTGACFLEDWLRILDGWEEMYLSLLMSFSKGFFNTLINSPTLNSGRHNLHFRPQG